MYQSNNEPAGSLERIHQNFDMNCLVVDDP